MNASPHLMNEVLWTEAISPLSPNFPREVAKLPTGLYLGCYQLNSFHHALFILPEPWLLGNFITFPEKVSNQLILYPDSALHCFSQTMIPSLCNYFCSLNTGHLLIPPSLHPCIWCILLLDIPSFRGLSGDRWCTHRVNWKEFNVGTICSYGLGDGNP